MPSCDNCNWRIQYDSKLADLAVLLAKFPPRHGTAGLIYDRQEVENWLHQAADIILTESRRKYR
jgi:hypothetical protein